MRIANPEQLPKHFDSKSAEDCWQRQWDEWRIYRYDGSRSYEETFKIDTPPPTVSGSLHVGHIFSYTHTDIIARFQRMCGKNIFYPMGWDDNGLPTERRVQNYYEVRCDPSVPYDPKLELVAEQGKSSEQRRVSRRNFIELCLQLTAEDERAFKELWRRIGLSVDWEQEYSTIDERCRRAAQFSFLDLYAKGHVYSLEAPTAWDVDFQTAVAQAEIEDRPVPGNFYDIVFDLEDGGSFVIATTRPELLPACVGVTFHPDDVRYRHLLGKTALTPLFDALVPIFASDLVDPEKGTGILMVCTFGDATDVHWWRTEHLPLRQIIGRDGRLMKVNFGEAGWPSKNPDAANAHYSALAGKNVRQARAAMVEALRPALRGEPRPIEHSVKFYEKGERPLEFISTRQWFVRLRDKKEQLLAAGDQIEWHPEFMRHRYRSWTENLAFDWAISRQRYFGVPFPVWYRLNEDGQRDFEHPILADAHTLPIDPASTAPPGYSEGQRNQPGGFAADADVFDTWFTSSLTPQITSGWEVDAERHKKLFPMDVRPQSHEIIRTWAFYTIVKSLLHENSIPWANVAISGWVLDPDRKKMSKSKGNVITPIALLDEYGSDAVRYWSANARLGTDTAFDTNVLKVGKRLVTKLFNAGKFVLTQSGEPGPIQNALDVSFLANLLEVVRSATRALHDFEHAAALSETERFFWHGFTDHYLEMVKARARSETDIAGRGSALAALQLALSVFLRLFAPFLPFITEEVWSWEFAKSVHVAAWPAAHEFPAASSEQENVFETAIAALGAVKKAKSEAKVSVAQPVSYVVLKCNDRSRHRLEAVLEDVKSAGRMEKLELVDEANLADNVIEIVSIQLT
jgi:valyl-tRNA synthetase